MTSDLSGKTISIRQTKDPFVADVQYIAFSKTTLDVWGRLDMRKLGVGVPGDYFMVMMGPGVPASRRGNVWGATGGFLIDMALKECFSVGEDGLVITVIELKDVRAARKRNYQRDIDEAHERRMRYWTGWFKTITSPVARFLESPVSTAAGSPKSCIGKGIDGGLLQDGPQTDRSAVVVPERPNAPDRSGLTHRRREGVQMITECEHSHSGTDGYPLSSCE